METRGERHASYKGFRVYTLLGCSERGMQAWKRIWKNRKATIGIHSLAAVSDFTSPCHTDEFDGLVGGLGAETGAFATSPRRHQTRDLSPIASHMSYNLNC